MSFFIKFRSLNGPLTTSPTTLLPAEGGGCVVLVGVSRQAGAVQGTGVAVVTGAGVSGGAAFAAAASAAAPRSRVARAERVREFMAAR